MCVGFCTVRYDDVKSSVGDDAWSVCEMACEKGVRVRPCTGEVVPCALLATEYNAT